MANRHGWARGYPDGCTDPLHQGDRTRVQHGGHGLCRNCIKTVRNKGVRSAPSDPLAEFADRTASNGTVAPVGDGADPLVDDAPVGPETLNESSDSPYAPPQPERRPGSVGTPSPAPASAGAVGSTGTASTNTGETQPAAPPKGLRKFLPRRGSGKDPESGSPALTPTREKRPGGRGARRESAADTISDGWAVLGGVAERTGHLPLGRCLQWQAPVAGEMIDEAVKGSFVDRLALQRIVRGRAKFDLLGAVLGPPLIVFAIEQNPERADALLPILAASIRQGLPLMVPAIKKQQRKAAEVAEATELLFQDDPNYTPGMDPVEYILGMMFAGWVPPQAAPAEPPAGEPAAV